MKEFSKDKLKHVETVEKNALPSAGGTVIGIINFNIPTFPKYLHFPNTQQFTLGLCSGQPSACEKSNTSRPK